ncbi:MAG: antibiotic biosynthesis monooxygenase [Sporichthyaceae bacterium]
MAETWLRIVTYNADGGKKGSREYLEQSLQDTIRMLQSTSGFRGGHWGQDEDANVLAAVTNWETREAIEAVSADLKALHEDRKKHGLKVATSVNLKLITAPTSWSAGDWSSITSRKSSNWLRVYLYDIDGKDPGAAEHLRNSTQDVIKVLKSLQGFRIGYWGYDAESNKAAAVTYWDGLESINLANAELERLHELRKGHGVKNGTTLNLQLLHTEIAPGGAAHGWI